MKYKIDIPGAGLSNAKLLHISLKEINGKILSSDFGWKVATIECSPEDLTFLMLKVGISLREEVVE